MSCGYPESYSPGAPIQMQPLPPLRGSCSKHNCSDVNTLSSINQMKASGGDLAYFKPGDSPLSNDTKNLCLPQQIGWDELKLGEEGRADLVVL